MKSEPLVSVVVPTFNSERTIEICLRSVNEQSYSNVEVIVVDSYSNDGTREIAEKLGVRIVTTKEKLLGARFKGLEESRGEFVLLMDSDQILEKTAIARALGIFREYDMLCLEEHSYRPRTWIERLFEADRCLVHNLANVRLDPLEGVLLARFYKREVLAEAFEVIPKKLMPVVVAHDHAIIYYEAYRISKKVGVLPNAVWHLEPTSLVELWKKNYRYGKTTRELLKRGFYHSLLRKKVRFRKDALTTRNWKYVISSNLLLTLKGIAYLLGYWSSIV